VLSGSTDSTCVALDLIFSDDTTLHDAGVGDGHGHVLHPASQCNHLRLDIWNRVTATLGSTLNGKTIIRINVGFDNGASLGGYRGYIDDIQIVNAGNYVPAQFIAKQYTEALGRAPGQTEWQTRVGYFHSNGCSAATLSAVGRPIYTSTTFNNLGYDNAAKLLTLYRGALNREPDPPGFESNLNVLNRGAPWSTVVAQFFTSSEFNELASTICNNSAPNYMFGTQPVLALMAGRHGYTGSEAGLQTILNSAHQGSTVSIAQKTVIPITTPLVVPRGVTLATYGTPSPSRYALMGRLVRGSTFQGGVVAINGGGALTNVWVDGQQSALGYGKQLGGASDAADVVSLGGAGTTISNNRLTDTDGGTSIYAVGAADGPPCSHETIRGNVLTSYPSSIEGGHFSDGLTIRCEHTAIENNQIIDPSDGGIVLFATSGVAQASQIKKNTIVLAGNDATEGLSADAQTANAAGTTLDYSHAVFSGNTLWTGPNTHFILGLTAGVRVFFGGSQAMGTGATFTHNTTGSLAANVRIGIAVDGMRNVTIARNTLRFNVVSYAGLGQACPPDHVAAEVSATYASGTIPTPYDDRNIDGCAQ